MYTHAKFLSMLPIFQVQLTISFELKYCSPILLTTHSAVSLLVEILDGKLFFSFAEVPPPNLNTFLIINPQVYICHYICFRWRWASDTRFLWRWTPGDCIAHYGLFWGQDDEFNFVLPYFLTLQYVLFFYNSDV